MFVDAKFYQLNNLAIFKWCNGARIQPWNPTTWKDTTRKDTAWKRHNLEETQPGRDITRKGFNLEEDFTRKRLNLEDT